MIGACYEPSHPNGKSVHVVKEKNPRTLSQSNCERTQNLPCWRSQNEVYYSLGKYWCTSNWNLISLWRFRQSETINLTSCTRENLLPCLFQHLAVTCVPPFSKSVVRHLQISTWPLLPLHILSSDSSFPLLDRCDNTRCNVGYSPHFNIFTHSGKVSFAMWRHRFIVLGMSMETFWGPLSYQHEGLHQVLLHISTCFSPLQPRRFMKTVP